MPLALWTDTLSYRSLPRSTLALLSRLSLECEFAARCIYERRSRIGASLCSRVVRVVV